MTQLITGQKYDVQAITLIGWTDGDWSGANGYSVWDYFSPAGEYRGPDCHGIEPVVSIAENA